MAQSLGNNRLGLFAGFNLDKYRHLQDLANALEYWLAGGRDGNNKKMKRLTQLQAGSIADIAYRMSNSPLLTEIIMPLLHVRRDGGRNAPPELLAAGKDLQDYAIPGAWHPTSAAYQDALLAWQNRRPVQREGYLHPRHKEMTKENIRRYDAIQEQREKIRTDPKVIPGIVADYTDSSGEELQSQISEEEMIPITTLTPCETVRSSGSASSSQSSQEDHTSDAERPSEKRWTNALPETAFEANTALLPPLGLISTTQFTEVISNNDEESFMFLPPLISNPPQPPIIRSSSGYEASSTSLSPTIWDEPLPQTSPVYSSRGLLGFLNTFDGPLHPQNRRSSSLSQVVTYDDMKSEILHSRRSARTSALDEEEEQFRQEQRREFVMTYDLPRHNLQYQGGRGNILNPRAGSGEENGANSTQLPEFVLEDPTRSALNKSQIDTPFDDREIVDLGDDHQEIMEPNSAFSA